MLSGAAGAVLGHLSTSTAGGGGLPAAAAGLLGSVLGETKLEHKLGGRSVLIFFFSLLCFQFFFSTLFMLRREVTTTPLTASIPPSPDNKQRSVRIIKVLDTLTLI